MLQTTSEPLKLQISTSVPAQQIGTPKAGLVFVSPLIEN